jgi:hypothetical protein
LLPVHKADLLFRQDWVRWSDLFPNSLLPQRKTGSADKKFYRTPEISWVAFGFQFSKLVVMMKWWFVII